MAIHQRNRKVKRCLVMLEYEEGDPNNGEVFDLTELIGEMAPKFHYNSGHIQLQISTESDYNVRDEKGKYAIKTLVSWTGHALGADIYMGSSSHLEDIVNSIMPDGERVLDIKKRIKRAQKKVEQWQHECAEAKMQQVAAIRHQHPIARVTQTAPALAEVSQA